MAYLALVNRSKCTLRAGTDAARAEWFDVQALPSLAFDHAAIVEKGLQRLRGKVRYEPIGFNLLPPTFLMVQLHALYEAVLDRPIDLPNFRRTMTRMGLLKEVGEETNVSHRPAKFFKFDEKAYARLVKKGFNFEV